MYSPTRKRSDSTSGVVDLDMSSDTPVPASASLDVLLSPTTKTNELEKRESVVDSGIDLEADGDEERFSNVPLSGKTALSGGPDSRGSLASVLLERRSTMSLGKAGSAGSSPKVSRHKKSASSYTVGSSGRASIGNLPFLLQRLDLQKAQGDTNRRVSQDGQQRLKAEFDKLHNGHQVDSEDDEALDSIDWGRWIK